MKSRDKMENTVVCTLWQVLRRNKAITAALLLVVAATVGCSLAPPQVLRQIIDRCLEPRSAKGLLPMAVLYLAALLAGYLCEFIKQALLVCFGQKMTRAVRLTMMEKSHRVRAAYYTVNRSGEIASRFLSDVDAIGDLFTGGVVGMAIDCCKIVGIVVSISLFSRRLGLLALALLPAVALVTRVVQRGMLRAQKENRLHVGRINGHIAETVKNMRIIKVMGCERYLEGRYNDSLARNYAAMERVNFYDAIYSPIILVVRALVIVTIVLLASPQVHALGITLGMAAASIDLFTNLFAPVESLGMELQAIQLAVSGVARVNEFCREEEADPPDGSLTAAGILAGPGPLLRFDGVEFWYEEGAPVLRGLTLDIEKGENVTLTGRTGVGKTTLFNLIMGVYHPIKGRVLLQGTPVDRIPAQEKRRLIGYVSQHFEFVPGTIRDQVTLGDETIAQSDVHRAMALVGLHDLVMGLPQGYDTPVAEGALFSQGQKQLLGIARAVAARPPLLLLDEITAGLDSRTEEWIMGVLRRVGQGCTLLTISHRLSSIRNCDKVVVLEKGVASAQGAPDELLRTNPWLRRSAEMQRHTWA